MRYLYTILFALFISIFSYGNIITITGKVSNNEQQALQYVSIGIINKTIGTISDENGDFILRIEENQIESSDSLKFSMIGYNSKSFLINEILDIQTLIVILPEKIETIPEAIITGNKLKTKVKGTTHFPAPLYVMLSNSELPDQNLGSAIARSFNINNENTIIEDIKFYIYSNYDTTTIRINIYSVKRRKPYKSILNTGIYTQITGKKHDWVHVDLKPYNISVDNDIIVALEWVDKSTKGDYLFFPLARPSVASHYYKYGSQNKWKRFAAMSSLMELRLKY
ncbi:MAG: carboxypeptidase-like regulatory domain-containing protein [Bacteroidales bacterium]|nr:carboxypeptidase-like regulatory domain-containing protein [Bacteroidales bacterium]